MRAELHTSRRQRSNFGGFSPILGPILAQRIEMAWDLGSVGKRLDYFLRQLLGFYSQGQAYYTILILAIFTIKI